MAEKAFSESIREAEKMASSVLDAKKAKAAVVNAVDEGVDAMRDVVRRGRHVAEGLADDAARGVRRYPLETVAIAFGAALAGGFLLGWLLRRK